MHDKIILNNGTTLLIDTIPYSNTVCTGFWVNVGSRDEGDGQHGFSHFIEHMLFKGTKNRSYLDIAVEVDELGGEINGATSKEFTYYYINVAKKYFKSAIDILADIYFNPSFNRDEFDNEKRVIVDELDSINDDPEEFVNDFFSTTLWGENSFGYPIIGIRNDIEAATVEGLEKYYKLHYNSQNLIISIAGGMNVEEVLSAVKNIVNKKNIKNTEIVERKIPDAYYRRNFQGKDIEQVYFISGRDSYSYKDKRRYPMILLNSIIGGSFSSILFQEIREKRGLCYSISSSYVTYSDIGELSIGFSTSGENTIRVLELINKIIRDVKNGLIEKKDLERAKKKFYGNYMLASENNEWLMSRLAMNEMIFGRIIPFDEVMAKVEQINIDDIYEIIDDIFDDKKFAIASIGPENIREEIEKFRFNF